MGRGGEGECFCESREVVGWKRTCEMGEWVGDWFVCGQTTGGRDTRGRLLKEKDRY